MKKTNGPNPQPPPESPALVAATAAVRETRRALNQALEAIDYTGNDGTYRTQKENFLFQAEQAAKLPALAAAYAAAWGEYLKARGIEK
jgi:hypothetical protein